MMLDVINNPLTNARHIVVEGPVGAGKTNLALRLAGHLEATLQLEQASANPFLQRFYQDPKRYALQTQLFFLFQRLDQQQELTKLKFSGKTVVSDSLLERDPLFAQMTLADDEYQLYTQVYKRLASKVGKPDLVIYLHARPEVLIARIKKRGHEIDRRMGEGYLSLLAERYALFFYQYNAAPILIVNAENLNFVESEDDFQFLLTRLGNMRGPRETLNRGT